MGQFLAVRQEFEYKYDNVEDSGYSLYRVALVHYFC
jgi:hypothetical protein